jgi:hypothetical protein
MRAVSKQHNRQRDNQQSDAEINRIGSSFKNHALV